MTIVRLASACLLVVGLLGGAASAETSSGTVTCKDGTTGPGGRGACRGHGGVDKSKTAGEAATAPAEKSAATATTVTCKDGTTGPGGSGACRGHGGIDKGKTTGAAAPAAAAPAAMPAAAQAAPEKVAAHGKSATADPSGAIARCKDGAYWHGAEHRGACSHHGGVADWLDGTK
jgi:hypothetical protein